MTTLPTIHLNGTGATTLASEYGKACEAVRDAIRALEEATFHQRDFYPQGEDAWKQAQEERQEVRAALSEALDYASRWYEHALEFETP